MVHWTTRCALLLLRSLHGGRCSGRQPGKSHTPDSPGDTHPLDLHPWGPDPFCSVTPRESKPYAPSPLGTLHPPHRDPGQPLGSLIMWRPPEQTRSRNHSRCPRRADTTKDREAAAQGQPTWRTWRTVSPGNGGPSPQEEGSLLKGQGTHTQGGGATNPVGTDEHPLRGRRGGSEPGENPDPKERTSQPREDSQPRRGAVN